VDGTLYLVVKFRSLEIALRFGGKYRLYLQDENVNQAGKQQKQAEVLACSSTI
jgi:hypothetical protein